MKLKTVIKIQGHLNDKWKECFANMEITHEGNNTIFTGNFNGEAHVNGILDIIRDNNLILISINSVERYQIVSRIFSSLKHKKDSNGMEVTGSNVKRVNWS